MTKLVPRRSLWQTDGADSFAFDKKRRSRRGDCALLVAKNSVRSVDAGAQDTSRQVAAMTAVLVEHLAVDDGVLDALRGHHQAPAAAGQVIAHFGPPGRI